MLRNLDTTDSAVGGSDLESSWEQVQQAMRDQVVIEYMASLCC
jgi:hypothetical protein